mgnify:CR=1 FL=1
MSSNYDLNKTALVLIGYQNDYFAPEGALVGALEGALAGGGSAIIDIGFTRDPTPVDWAGGEIAGIIAPGGRIVAVEPVAGLEQLSPPDPSSLPNNHLAYAGQWFFFALTALIVYVVALRRRSTPAKPG